MIQVRNVSKRFGARMALHDIDFRVDVGQVVGLLGSNGAGKTTMMRIVAGFLAPTGGAVEVAGHDLAKQPREVRRCIGYLPETVPLYREMSVHGYLVFMARLRGLSKRSAKIRAQEVVRICGLVSHARAAIGTLSKGFRQRVGMAQAIVHDPPVLVLDEPTAAIDPIQSVETRRLISELGRDRAILLSTHILSEASALCERVVILKEGRVVAEDRVEALSSRLGGEALRMRLRIDGPPQQVTARLQAIPSIASAEYADPFHLVEFAPGAQPQRDIGRAVVAEEGWTLISMETVEFDLEDLFLTLTGAR